MNTVWRRVGVGLGMIGAMSGCFAAGRALRGHDWQRPAHAATRQFADAGKLLPEANEKPAAAVNAAPADVFDEAAERIKRDFALESPDAALLDKAMVSRLVAGLNDPATRLLSREADAARRAALLGYQTGIGANLAITTGKQGDVVRRTLVVQSVVWGSPAETAGLRTGDRITEINGRWIIGTLEPDIPRPELPAEQAPKFQPKIANGITLPAARELLSLGDDKSFALTIERQGQAKPLAVDVRTAAVKAPAATFQWREAGIGHLSIRQCSRMATAFVQDVLTQHRSELLGLIVDLRQCSGGIRTDQVLAEINGVSTVAALVESLTAGGTAVHFQTRRRAEPLTVQGKGKPAYPVVIVVDKGTANLGEAAASALRELGDYPVVGGQTWGDDVLLHYALLRQGGGLEIAAAYLKTASGKSLKQGIVPDIAASGDAALDAATKRLQAERKSE